MEKSRTASSSNIAWHETSRFNEGMANKGSQEEWNDHYDVVHSLSHEVAKVIKEIIPGTQSQILAHKRGLIWR